MIKLRMISFIIYAGMSILYSVIHHSIFDLDTPLSIALYQEIMLSIAPISILAFLLAKIMNKLIKNAIFSILGGIVIFILGFLLSNAILIIDAYMISPSPEPHYVWFIVWYRVFYFLPGLLPAGAIAGLLQYKLLDL